METTKLSAKYIGSYRSKKGNTTFRYAISGNEKDLKAFEEAQGEFHRVDESTGKPLWFTTRFIGEKGTLLITANNKVVPDMTEFEKANSLAKQFGGNLGEELAKHAASMLMGGGNTNTQASVPQQEEEQAED